MSVQQQKFKEIADAIREKTGSTDLIKPSEFAEKIGEVYETGKNAIWDSTLRGGARTSCEYAFNYWDIEYIRPPFVWKPTSRTVSCFQNCRKLKKIEKQYLDFSGCSSSGASTSGHYNTVIGCESLEVFEDIGLPVTGEYYQTWRANQKMHTIELVRSNKSTKYTSSFTDCLALNYIRFSGEIGQNISFSYCGKLSVESLKDIILHLVDYSGTADEYTKTLTLSSNSWAALAAEGATAPGGIAWRDYISNLCWLTD